MDGNPFGALGDEWGIGEAAGLDSGATATAECAWASGDRAEAMPGAGGVRGRVAGKDAPVVSVACGDSVSCWEVAGMMICSLAEEVLKHGLL